MKILILLFIYPAIMLAQTPKPGWKPVEFTITGPDGSPIKDAFVEASRRGPGNANGYTDSAGKVVIQVSKGATLHVSVSKDNYYTTGGQLWSGGMIKGPDKKLVAKEVADRFEIVLKPVVHPLDLAYTQFRGIVPAIGRPIGFDLQEGDWVRPYGSGSTADLLFHFHDIYFNGGAYGGTMSISFLNPTDGIQSFLAARPFSSEFGSNQAPPNKAPVDGYQNQLSYTIQHNRGEPYTDYKVSQRNYIVRTRSEADAMGVIRKACYGWIQGEIEFDPRDPRGPQLQFTSYFNPDPDPDARSLESLKHVPKER